MFKRKNMLIQTIEKLSKLGTYGHLLERCANYLSTAPPNYVLYSSFCHEKGGV